MLPKIYLFLLHPIGMHGVNHGNVSGLPAQEFHYIQFVKPVTARYIKVSIKGYHTGGVQLSSIKMFE